MSKIILKFLLSVFISASFACRTANTPDTNSNANSLIGNQSNLPPEFSASPISPSGNNTPGISAPKTLNFNAAPNGKKTPGIPNPRDFRKNLPKGTTPTPGIPDPEIIKKQMKTPSKEADSSSIANQRKIRKP